MDTAAARAQLKDLREDAYRSVLSCFQASTEKGMLKEYHLSQLRSVFGIDTDTHAAMVNEVHAGSSIVAAPVDRAPPPVVSLPPKPASKPKIKQLKPKGKAVMELNAEPPAPPASPTLVPQASHSMDSKAERKRVAGEFNFRMCKRNWPLDGGWCSGVIVNFKPETGACKIVYNFAKERPEKEDYNLYSATKLECIILDTYAPKKDINKWNKLNKGG